MTDEFKQKLLAYLTGKLKKETGVNEPIYSNIQNWMLAKQNSYLILPHNYIIMNIKIIFMFIDNTMIFKIHLNCIYKNL